MTRIALVGCGRWGRKILRDLCTLVPYVAVADPDTAATSAAHAAGAAAIAGSLEELPEVDGIVIATPSSTHAAVIERGLDRGVPIFVEKPMSIDPDSARRLAKLAPDRLFVMDKWRYHPGIEELRCIRQRGELGRPLGMHMTHVGWGSPHHDVDVSWILLPHCMSIMLEVFGVLPEPNRVFGETLNDRLVTVAGVLGSDPFARFEISSRSPVKRREFRLHCEGGVAWLDDGWADHIKIARGDQGNGSDAPDVEKRQVGTGLPLWNELNAFINYLRGAPSPRSSASEGALIVERIAQLRELARRRP